MMTDHPHFMLKEIYEQPEALSATLENLVREEAHKKATDLLLKASELVLLGCGTSRHSAVLGMYWFEELAGIKARVESPTEFLDRQPILTEDALVIGISQSGESSDLLSVIRELKKRGIKTLGITNQPGSSLCRDTDAFLSTNAGKEVAIPATKSFTAHNLALLLCAVFLSKNKGGDENRLKTLFKDIQKLPDIVMEILASDSILKQIKGIANEAVNATGVCFIGRGYSYPMALEAALKLKETTYIMAEGYAAGEFSHGPMALLEEGRVLITLAPKDRWFKKVMADLERIQQIKD